MKKIFLFITAAALIANCNNVPNKVATEKKANGKESCEEDDCCKGKDKTAKSAASRSASAMPIVCKLGTPELQKRRATVLESLRKQIVEKKELSNGYAFKFSGSDKTIDELAEFIKTERECCSFFTFNLSAGGDKSETWLELTGAEGVKDFINTELEFY